MKKTILFLNLTIIIASCAKLPSVHHEQQPEFAYDKIVTKSGIKEDAYAVTSNDIKNYVRFKQLQDKKKELKIESVEPFEYEGQTLLYVLNYNKGWEVISADKRTQVVLACGEEGSFTMKDYESTPWGTWVYTLAMDVLQTKMANPEATYGENADYEFWGQINGPLYLPSQVDSFIHIDWPGNPPGPSDGYYELANIMYEYNVDTLTIGPLTTTNWSQTGYRLGDNLRNNLYVPVKSDGSEHVPSGCTAVAGAQMAYYLHYKLGHPDESPYYSRYCSTYANRSLPIRDASFTPDYFVTDLWDQMDDPSRITTNTYESDMLIAYIGRESRMYYGDDGSGASLQNLKNRYFDNNSISCDYASSFDENIAYSELYYHEMPIVVAAYRTHLQTEGHAFLVDGCWYSRKRAVYTYEWRWYDYVDAGPGQFLPFMPPYSEVGECQYQEGKFIHMNWGWGGAFNNPEVRYAPLANWDPYNNNTPGFNYHKEMLHHFREN